MAEMSENVDKERKMYNFPGNARSDVWKHFGFYAVDDDAESIQVDKSKAICKICRLAIKNHGNTTNLYNHITKRHGRELALEFQTKMFSEPRFQCVPSSSNSLDFDKFNSNRHSIITKAIFDYLITDVQPMSAVHTPAFKNLLCRLDPKYELPSHDYLEHVYFSRIYEEAKQKILLDVQKNSNDCSMTIDIWQSVSVTWLSLSIQFINNSWENKSFLLKSIQIAENPDISIINQAIESCKMEWNTGDPMSVIGSSKLAKEAGDFSWYFIPCLAQTINSAALKGFERPKVCQLIDKCQRLIQYLENHFKEVVQNLESVIMDRARWLSIYEMFEWLSSNMSVIQEVLCGSYTKSQSLDLLLTSEEQILTENLLFAFKELKTASNILCKESQPFVSMILPILQKLLTSFSPIESDSSIICSVKKQVHEVLETTYQPEDIHCFLISASLLDPRYKELPFISDEQRNNAKETIFSKASLSRQLFSSDIDISKSVEACESPASAHGASSPKRIKVENEPSSSTCALDDWFSDVVCQQDRKENSELDKVSLEFNKFHFTDRVSANSDPLVWWGKHEILFPILSHIAKKFLCTPATSVSANQVFSMSGRSYEMSRSKLSSNEVDQLLFLNKNFKASNNSESSYHFI